MAFCTSISRLILQIEKWHPVRCSKTELQKWLFGWPLALNGGYNRNIRTSVGEFTLRFKRVKCGKCDATHVPLQKLIQFRRYQTKTNELEKLVVETVSETSYRRSVAQLSRDGKITLPYRTAHEWVLKTDCDEIQVSSKVIGSFPLEVMADGTKFKGEGVNGKARQGDLKVSVHSAH